MDQEQRGCITQVLQFKLTKNERQTPFNKTDLKAQLENCIALYFHRTIALKAIKRHYINQPT